MPQVTIQVIGGKVVVRALQNLRLKVPKILDANIKNAVEKIAKKARKYPKKRIGQKYIRTYTLQRSVRVVRMEKGKYQLNINPILKGKRYASYVIGDTKGEGQAWMHEGRWYLFQELTESVLKKLPKTIDDHLKRATKEVGL